MNPFKLFFLTEVDKTKLFILRTRIKQKQKEAVSRLKKFSFINPYDLFKAGYEQAIVEMKESFEVEAESEVEKRFLALREKYILEQNEKSVPTIEELLLLKDELHDKFLDSERTAEKYPDTKSKLIAIEAQRSLIDKLIERKTGSL